MASEDDPQPEDLSDIAFVKRVTVGNLNRPVSEEEMDAQIAVLNRCLQTQPRGRIIGKDVSTLLYGTGKAQVTVQQTTYHVGFRRKPYWAEDSEPEPGPESGEGR